MHININHVFTAGNIQTYEYTAANSGRETRPHSQSHRKTHIRVMYEILKTIPSSVRPYRYNQATIQIVYLWVSFPFTELPQLIQSQRPSSQRYTELHTYVRAEHNHLYIIPVWGLEISYSTLSIFCVGLVPRILYHIVSTTPHYQHHIQPHIRFNIDIMYD